MRSYSERLLGELAVGLRAPSAGTGAVETRRGFSGHGDFASLLFEDEEGKALDSPLDAIGALVGHHPSIKCVILNACNSVAALASPIAEFTIGMDSSVDDDAAIQFAQGFYDAIAAGKPYEFAVQEGKLACQTKGLVIPLRVLTR
jgi:hypothetical protein